MIFALAEDAVNKNTIFVLLCEKDLSDMRTGLTKFVDHRQLQGKTFERVVFALTKSDANSLELIKAAGHRVYQLAVPEPGPKESKCLGCEGLIETVTMFEGKCICCWAAEAKKLQLARN